MFTTALIHSVMCIQMIYYIIHKIKIVNIGHFWYVVFSFIFIELNQGKWK